MTTDQINIAVSELCGIVVFEETDGSGLWSATGPGWFRPKTGISREHALRVSIPDYAEDLNACQMFKDHLSDREKEMYAEYLDNDDGHRIKENDYIAWVEMPPWGAFQYATLPAIEHCKAFLMVKGKWIK